MTTPELETTAMADGGDAVARDEGGRVVFVEGALPGERVAVEIVKEEDRYARASLVEVIEAAPGRIDPICSEVAAGCGGCSWAHVGAATQIELKQGFVADAVRRLGGIEPPELESGPVLPHHGFRTTVRAAVHEGRAGFRGARSHTVIPVARCRVAHPRIEELIVEGRWGNAQEVTLRVGANTGEVLAMVSPSTEGVVVPDDVRLVGADELAAGRRAWIHEEIRGVRLRVSAQSFFQGRTDGAEALVETVRAAVGRAPERLVDLCCGVGLFGATVGSRSVIGVESNRSAVADARVNLGSGDGGARVVSSRFESWRPSAADVVIADPSRSGLGRIGIDKVVATGAPRVVLVSCRAAAAGRDIGLFVRAGYRPQKMVLVDMFPDTPHIEVVTTLLKE